MWGKHVALISYVYKKENGAWHREEWDATTLRGQVLRLVHQPDGWTVDALLD